MKAIVLFTVASLALALASESREETNLGNVVFEFMNIMLSIMIFIK